MQSYARATTLRYAVCVFVARVVWNALLTWLPGCLYKCICCVEWMGVRAAGLVFCCVYIYIQHTVYV